MADITRRTNTIAMQEKKDTSTSIPMIEEEEEAERKKHIFFHVDLHINNDGEREKYCSHNDAQNTEKNLHIGDRKT